MATPAGPPNTAAELDWEGKGLGFQARSSFGEIRLDARPEAGGSGPGVSPMQALLIAAAGCMAMDVLEILSKMRHPPAAYRIRCEGWRAADHPKRFVRLRLTHEIEGDVPQAQAERAVELSRTKYCSAMATLDPGLSIENLVNVVGARLGI